MAIGRQIKKCESDMGAYARRYANRRLRSYAQKRHFAEQALRQGPNSNWSTATRRRKMKVEVDPVIMALARDTADYLARLRAPRIVDAKPLDGE